LLADAVGLLAVSLAAALSLVQTLAPVADAVVCVDGGRIRESTSAYLI
jgi:hypothetical protein